MSLCPSHSNDMTGMFLLIMYLFMYKHKKPYFNTPAIDRIKAIKLVEHCYTDSIICTIVIVHQCFCILYWLQTNKVYCRCPKYHFRFWKENIYIGSRLYCLKLSNNFMCCIKQLKVWDLFITITSLNVCLHNVYLGTQIEIQDIFKMERPFKMS